MAQSKKSQTLELSYKQLVETLKFISGEFRHSANVCMSIIESMEGLLYPDPEYLARLRGEAAAYEVAAIKIDAVADACSE